MSNFRPKRSTDENLELLADAVCAKQESLDRFFWAVVVCAVCQAATAVTLIWKLL